ncbi:MAG: hypothetical protein KF773_29645 [Deltaproteobacteria bacterium]|nr:hypothetical protein [Deltaproteobacteria bacterium]
MRAKLILLGVAAAALLAAGIALWRMARSEPRAGAAPAPAQASAQAQVDPTRPPPARDAPAPPPDPDDDAVANHPPPTPPPPPPPTAGSARPPRALIVLSRLRQAVSRTDDAVKACITGKVSGRALLQFTAVPVDGRVSIEHSEVIPNVGKEQTSLEDRTLLDCLAKAHAGTPLSDVGDFPVIVRTRVVIEDGVMTENWLVSATPQHREE